MSNSLYLLTFFKDSSKGIYLKWVYDYNEGYQTSRPHPRMNNHKIINGFDVKIDLEKRYNYCSNNGIEFDTNLFMHRRYYRFEFFNFIIN